MLVKANGGHRGEELMLPCSECLYYPVSGIYREPVHSPSTDRGHNHGEVQIDSGVYGTKQLNLTVVLPVRSQVKKKNNDDLLFHYKESSFASLTAKEC